MIAASPNLRIRDWRPVWPWDYPGGNWQGTLFTVRVMPGTVPYRNAANAPDISGATLHRLQRDILPRLAHQRGVTRSQLLLDMNTATMWSA
jgi:hypothetical protein